MTHSEADRALPPAQVSLGSAKPEIRHVHRKPARRPPAVVALAFAALVLAELGVLLAVLSRHPAVNLGAWPAAGTTASLASTAFHAGIASILGLYLLFWLKLNILQTLPVLAVLALFTTVSGHQALSALAMARAKAA